MFKKVLSFLVFISFLMSSQMQLAHAFEMSEMTHGDTGVHTMERLEHSMFCETRDPASNKKSPECLKTISQNILIPSKQGLGNAIPNQTTKYLGYIQNIPYQREYIVYIHSPPAAPPNYQDLKSYATLVGIIKRLN